MKSGATELFVLVAAAAAIKILAGLCSFFSECELFLKHSKFLDSIEKYNSRYYRATTVCLALQFFLCY